MARSRSGKHYTWQMSDRPIGSGDAGEVYAAICQEQPEIIGVMKTPARIATSGTIQRQSRQIAREGQALAVLDGLPTGKAHPPRLLDEALDFTEGTAQFFIISETAPGVDLASLLTHTRQTGKPFPRRVAITVLDALFDMFARAHKAGILWNDVKLDHIYWHNSTCGITVIDWGNAIFLDHQDDSGRPTLPRWQDYQQLVESLGGFLQQSVPELYADLGWEEFEGETLDSPRVSVLARRIAYQQQVVSLNEMEYQALLRVLLEKEPALNDLHQILDYQHQLEHIGAPWPEKAIRQYASDLIRRTVKSGEVSSAVAATALLWDLFDNSLDFSWHLVREYFRIPDLLTHPKLSVLVEHTINENWSAGIWALAEIAEDLTDLSWWERLIPVMRQKALGVVNPPPYQICRSLQRSFQGQNLAGEDHAEKISEFLENWRGKGQGEKDSPFDYDLLMELCQNTPTVPLPSLRELKKSYALGKKAVRQVLQTWFDMNWDGLEQALQHLLAWDPDRWGILALAERINQFQEWLKRLHRGPRRSGNEFEFLKNILAERPAVEKVLGRPPWFIELIATMQDITPDNLAQKDSMFLSKWCPWLNKLKTLAGITHQSNIQDNADEADVLSHFINHLKNWSDQEAGLQMVLEKTPHFHDHCQDMVDQFYALLSLNYNPDAQSAISGASPHPLLDQAEDILEKLQTWRKHLENQDLHHAEAALKELSGDEWALVTHCRAKTVHWRQAVQPHLAALKEFNPMLIDQPQYPDSNAITMVSAHLDGLMTKWNMVYRSGLYHGLIEDLQKNIEEMRTAFINWRKNVEQEDHRVSLLLYHYDLPLIQRISENLERLRQNSQQVALSLSFLEGTQDQETRFRLMNDILTHLTLIESILISQENQRQFPAWQSAFQSILGTKDPEALRQLGLSFPEDFPLYGILVQSIFEN